VKSVLRIAIGFAAFAGGLTFLVYGIAQAITTGSCGSSSSGMSYGPCPSGFGPMIALMVLGTLVAIVGLGIAAGSPRGVGRFIAALIVAVLAGLVLGFVDLHSDDTRPGLEILAAVVAPLLLFTLPGLGMPTVQTLKAQPAAMPAEDGPIEWQPRAAEPATSADAEDIASRLRQLNQLRDSGLLDDAAYNERRAQILAEL
jgi:hypothetical protein